MARTKFSRKAEGWLEKARCASVGLLGLGLLVATFFGASDRLAMAGVLPPFVPGEAVDIDRPDQIAASARAALNRDPVNQRLLGLWGSAELARGEDARAEAIFRVAGGLGWRDRPTQLYWYAVARDGGDFVVAASRLDALLRTGANEFLPELRELESVSAGRAARAC